MTTLREIIRDTNRETETQRAVRAAYWAGQSMMRGLITEQLKQRLDSLPQSRYHRLVRAAAEHMCIGVPCINSNYLHGRGDSGTGEAAEIMDWDFDLEVRP